MSTPPGAGSATGLTSGTGAGRTSCAGGGVITGAQCGVLIFRECAFYFPNIYHWRVGDFIGIFNMHTGEF